MGWVIVRKLTPDCTARERSACFDATDYPRRMPKSTQPISVLPSDLALFTDLYQLTMLQAYWHERQTEEAVFSLFVRRLPENRNYLLACGMEDALRSLEAV